jgi:hypothetical protein
MFYSTKTSAIERFLPHIRKEHLSHEAVLETGLSQQDPITLNSQRACSVAHAIRPDANTAEIIRRCLTRPQMPYRIKTQAGGILNKLYSVHPDHIIELTRQKHHR